MFLLDSDLMNALPGFNQSDKKDPVVHAKFYIEDGGIIWYAVEGQVERNDYCFFGIVDSVETTFRYFRLSYLETLRGPASRLVERDENFKPSPLSQIPDLEGFWKDWRKDEPEQGN